MGRQQAYRNACGVAPRSVLVVGDCNGSHRGRVGTFLRSQVCLCYASNHLHPLAKPMNCTVAVGEKAEDPVARTSLLLVLFSCVVP